MKEDFKYPSNSLYYSAPSKMIETHVKKDNMKVQKKKIIYVDIDGTISHNPELPDFGDRHADYKKAAPLTDRINHINRLYLSLIHISEPTRPY